LPIISLRREKIRDYEAGKCIDDDDDEWCLESDKVGMSGPDPDLIMPLKHPDKLPRNIIRDYQNEGDTIPNYMLTPLEDESHVFNTSHKPFMIQRFEKQPLPTNASFSSINTTPFSSSLDSANSAMDSPCSSVSKQFPKEHEKPFRIKNIHVSERNQMYTKPSENAKANIKFTLGDDSDDQYVTLLPSVQPVV